MPPSIPGNPGNPGAPSAPSASAAPTAPAAPAAASMPWCVASAAPTLAMAPWRLSGVVVGALVNHAPELAELGEAVAAAPYKAAPRHPVLQVKPRNTLAAPGACVPLPGDVPAVALGATLGIVIGRSARKVAVADALAHVAGYLAVCDLHVPSDAANRHYRPGVRQRARDGFCPLGPLVTPAAQVPRPDELAVRVLVNGQERQRTDTRQRVRGVAALIADVSEFMTLNPGDVLLLGASAGAPRVAAGSAAEVQVLIEGLAPLHFSLAPETAELAAAGAA